MSHHASREYGPAQNMEVPDPAKPVGTPGFADEVTSALRSAMASKQERRFNDIDDFVTVFAEEDLTASKDGAVVPREERHVPAGGDGAHV